MGNTINFGLHLTLDGYGGDPLKLNDEKLVQQALDELPGKINMHKLADPVVYFAPASNPKDSGGWSGMVVIMESHISCHTFPHRQFASIDVYTCADTLDQDFVIKYFTDLFDFQDVETNFLRRGTRFPDRDLA